MKNNNYENSIGFFETIDIAILYKKTIFIFFIIFLLLSLTYIYIFNKEEEFYSSYSISTLSGFESNEVDKLNYLLNEIHTGRLIKQTLILSGTLIIPQNDIFAENILYGKNTFQRIEINELMNYFYVAINSEKIQEKVNNEFIKKYPNKALPRINIHTLSAGVGGKYFFIVNIFYNDVKVIKDYSQILFQAARQEVINKIQINIHQTKLFFENNVKKAIESLVAQNEILRKEFKNKMNEIVINLTEQATIARKMNLDFPPELSQTENLLSRLPFEYPSNSPVSVTALSFLSSASYTYLRGYVSLEEEINLIKNRVKADDFIPAIRNNLQAVQSLRNNKFGSEEMERLNQYNVSSLNFYNMIEKADILIKKTYLGLSKNIFILLFSFCGIFLGLIFSILRHSYDKYKLLR